MKQPLLMFAVIVMTMSSCTKSDSADPTPTSLEGKWRMIVVTENISGRTTTKPTTIQKDVDITFTPAGATNGTFIGNTPTNDIWQCAYSVGVNDSISIPCLSMTKVMETSWGKEFVNNIRSSYRYNFVTGGRLNIETTNKTLTFKKM